MEIVFKHTFLANNGTDREVVHTTQNEAQEYFFRSVLTLGELEVSEADRLIFYAYSCSQLIRVEKIIVIAPSHVIRFYARIVRISEAYCHAQIWRGERTTRVQFREDGVAVHLGNVFARQAITLLENNESLLHFHEDELFRYFEEKLFTPRPIP